MPTDAPYRGSITREQWLLRETRTVARLRNEAGESYDPADLVARVCNENLFQYPTERELASVAKACDRRLTALSQDPATRAALIDLIANGTADQSAQANLYAMARDNRIVWDFLAAVVAHKFRTLDRSLTRPEIASFVEGLRAQDEKIARCSDATLNKIRQVLTACLVQCGMYDRRSERLAPPLPDRTLENCIRANGDYALLPAFGSKE
ncbi:DUF1819 family protein [Paratractidigestivibacter sp.]|uniref:DUF1819 family protein n=1 Tax=Paratractidigestivibacter sp. TaxID=2847316 RepID=UPI002ABD22E9|nr:DUF1819 family protein [Paratractidigestivibacter sp.]